MLDRLQRQLERTYELHVGHAVQDFLITDPALASAIDSSDHPDVPEKLLIREGGRDLDVGLFIDERVMAALSRDDPTARLHPGNLESFLIALEGVSHFLYLVFNATYARPISLFELELQAEVDKYVTAAFLFAHQLGRVPSGLGRRLFDDPILHPELSPESARRYEAANYYAARYCAELERVYLRGRADGLMRELRRFYRLPQEKKLRHIRRLN